MIRISTVTYSQTRMADSPTNQTPRTYPHPPSPTPCPHTVVPALSSLHAGVENITAYKKEKEKEKKKSKQKNEEVLARFLA